MRMFAALLAALLLWAPASAETPLRGARQLLLVVAESWDSPQGTLRRFERAGTNTAFRQVGDAVPIVVGRNGLGWGRGLHESPSSGPVKQEGDGKGPAGIFRLGTAFGHSHQKLEGLRWPYRGLGTDVECVDDARSRHYNRLVRKREVARADWNSSEKMWEEKLYRWGVVVEHNSARTQAGGGSCIFLHTWMAADRGTAGCTAMAEENLRVTMHWLERGKRPLLVQLPQSEYRRLKSQWGLP